MQLVLAQRAVQTVGRFKLSAICAVQTVGHNAQCICARA
ncbi:hypothetical protein A2U01_0079564, partial [Trifolium medium]|nr:hypothetical protein [Trifolium medium]